MTTDNWFAASLAVPIRQFTEQGIERFHAYLTKMKDGATDPLPIELLYDDRQARILDRHVSVEPGTFATTLEMANYLYPRINELQLSGKYYDPGLWAWLTAFYLDTTCPSDSLGNRKVGEMARYIPPKNREFRLSIRHQLAVALRMYDTHGELRMRLFLFTHPSEQSTFLRQIMDLQELSANSNILDALQILYWDNDTQRPKRGSSKDSPGSLIRFIALMNQFNRTFDLFAMSGKQIVKLLPKDEFARWLS